MKKNKAFTLIELMVVMGIIAIFASVAVPGFKTAYQNMKREETIEEASAFLEACRSFYLVKNEFPSDSQPGKINTEMKWALPKYLYKGSVLTKEPYSGGYYDIENWENDSTHFNKYGLTFFSLRFVDNKFLNFFENKLTERLGRNCFSVEWSNGKSNYTLLIPFSEQPGKAEMQKETRSKYRNRYY